MAVFVAAYVGACVFFLPAFILTLGAGFAWGVGTGALLVWIGASLGASVAFLLGRTVARDGHRAAGRAERPHSRPSIAPSVARV
jgi:uncharacterized membrane protein YdjX (TVP38/TMEM64 family)